MSSIRFWFGMLLTVVVFSALVKLGFWQLSRGEDKQQVESELSQRLNAPSISLDLAVSRFDLQSLTGVKVSVDVTPLPLSDVATVLLDNQTFEGKVGYLAYQVVSDGDQRFFLLERGFVAGLKQRSQLPNVTWIDEPQAMEGRLYQKSINPLSSDLGLEKTNPLRIQNLNIPYLSRELGLTLEPFVFQPQQDDWPYLQPWQPVPMRSAKHFGYAVQWFSMALVFALLSGYVLVRAVKKIKIQGHDVDANNPVLDVNQDGSKNMDYALETNGLVEGKGVTENTGLAENNRRHKENI
ncbi:SURF1 family protein [Vibrio sp. YMD68]|uniref:SURF1 family protein n=1 Tax=Vibrio sp. YMD68 TaxID=3042300 RepID=UPI00249C6384|nr:SURF1 family protein [Vibrio sp. YMD68]WGV98717.1 SURF1 family protein [Vibrio sp. YMD68]